MRNLFLFLTFLSILTKIYAQNTTNSRLDSMLVGVDKSSLSSEILYDRVVPWSQLTQFNDSLNVSNARYFEQALFELHQAANQEKFPSLSSFKEEYIFDANYKTVELGIINSSFHSLNYRGDNENEGGLSLEDEAFEKIENDKPIFIEHHLFMASPLKEYVIGPDVHYLFNNNLILEENEGMKIVDLRVNFGQGQEYNLITNNILANSEFSIHYSTQGNKTIQFTATFEDGNTLVTEAIIHVKLIAPITTHTAVETDSINASIPYQGYEEASPFYGRLKYRTFFAGNEAVLRKPIVIIDGFDPGDRRKIQDYDSPLPNDKHTSIYEMMTYQNENGAAVLITPILQELGYDVVIVNQPTHQTTINNYIRIDGGADYIERNALAHIALYQRLNQKLQQNNSQEELIIVGPSMGGQISRYALAYMEKHNIPHNTRLWVSIDSPHLGANIPLGLQTLLNQAAVSGNAAAEEIVTNLLGSAAARQQLVEQFNGSTGNTLNQSWMNAKTISQGFSETRGSHFFTNYYDHLFNNGLEGSNGYPVNLRKVALVNGSLSGSKSFYNPFINENDVYGNNGEIGLNIRGFQEICSPWPVCWDVHIGSLEAYNMPNYLDNTKVARFKKAFTDRSKYATNNNSRGNMDNIPGGWFPGFNELAEPIDGTDPIVPSGTFWSWEGAFNNILSILSDILGGAALTVYANEHVHSFIPTVSALGMNYPNFNWSENLNRNLVCSSETPFDAYYGPKINERHTSFTQQSISWLLKELAGDLQESTVYLTETDLQGPEAICQNDLVTFEFETCVSPPVSSWEVSDNLEIITSDDFSVTVRSINSSNNTGSITAIYPYQAVQKDVWVGKPGPPSYLNGPELVPSGGLVQYNGGVAQGASSYQWWLPHPFEIRNPFDLFGDHWQVHPSAGRSTQVFTGYAGTDGLVQLIGENECGLGSAAIMEVSHGTGGDGDPPLPVYPYPNSSNEAFKLDFSYYEEGSYGIFIYDQFSNLLYEGESSNIEKTISTSEIANGVYFLHIHLNDEVKQYQLLVSH